MTKLRRRFLNVGSVRQDTTGGGGTEYLTGRFAIESCVSTAVTAMANCLQVRRSCEVCAKWSTSALFRLVERVSFFLCATADCKCVGDGETAVRVEEEGAEGGLRRRYLRKAALRALKRRYAWTD